MRIAAGILGAIVLVLGAIVATALLIDWNMFRDEVAELAGDRLGRDVSIGALDVDIGWTTHVDLRDVAVANPGWAEHADLARVEHVRGAVKPWSLIRDPVSLPYLRIEGASIALEQQEDGGASWQFGARSGGDGSGDSAFDWYSRITSIEISRTTVTIRDADSGLDVSGNFALAEGEVDGPQGVQLDLSGTLRGEPVDLALTGGALRSLRDRATEYPLSFDLRSGSTQVMAEGHLTDPPDLDSFVADATARGPGLHLLLPSLKLPLPNTPPYNLAATIRRDGAAWSARDLVGTVGESDIAGTVEVDSSGEKASVAGELVTDRLLFDDLAPLVGLRKPGSGRGDDGRGGDGRGDSEDGGGTPGAVNNADRLDGIFPDVPLADERLYTANVDIRYRANEVVSEILPFESVAGRIVVRDGVLIVENLDMAIAGGEMGGNLRIDSRKSPNVSEVFIVFDRIGLRPFFGNSRFVEEMGGRFSGNLEIAGTGQTLADVMSTANGDVVIGMSDGTINALLVEAAGLDLTESLGLLIEDARVGIRCAKAAARFDQGVTRLDRVIVDTTDSTLVAKGSVDLDAQVLDLVVSAFEKDFSLIDLASPVRLNGPLKDPSFSIAEIDPLPFFELGEQEDIDCQSLLSGTSEAPRERTNPDR